MGSIHGLGPYLGARVHSSTSEIPGKTLNCLPERAWINKKPAQVPPASVSPWKMSSHATAVLMSISWHTSAYGHDFSWVKASQQHLWVWEKWASSEMFSTLGPIFPVSKLR